MSILFTNASTFLDDLLYERIAIKHTCGPSPIFFARRDLYSLQQRLHKPLEFYDSLFKGCLWHDFFLLKDGICCNFAIVSSFLVRVNPYRKKKMHRGIGEPRKDEEIYNVFNTAKILARPPRVAVDKTSGTAGVSWWINSYFSLPATQRVDKKSTAVRKITEWVDAQYQHERTTSISDEEMLAQARLHLPQLTGVPLQ